HRAVAGLDLRDGRPVKVHLGGNLALRQPRHLAGLAQPAGDDPFLLIHIAHRAPPFGPYWSRNRLAASSTVNFFCLSAETKMFTGTTPSPSGLPSLLASLRTIVGTTSLWKPFTPPCGRVFGVIESASSWPKDCWHSFRMETSSWMVRCVSMSPSCV